MSGHSQTRLSILTFATMKTNNYEVIDQFFAAQLSANESEATLNALRDYIRIRLLLSRSGLRCLS